jgi:DNA-binding GntR family transcriptional regulator
MEPCGYYRAGGVMADPLYRQIAQDLMRKIDLGLQPDDNGELPPGALPPGAQLPNEDALKVEYSASRNTVRDAIKWLAGRRLVMTRPGLGTFVAPRIEPIVTTLSDDPTTGQAGGEGAAAFNEVNKRQAQKGEPETARASAPTVEIQEAPEYVAERLRINTGDEVLVRHQEFYIADAPYMLQTTFYPMDLVVKRGATLLTRPKDIQDGTVKYLAEVGIAQCGTRLRVLVRAPNDSESRFFGLSDDARVWVVSLIRTGYEERPDEGPFPYRVTFTVLPADRNQFVMNSGKVPEELAAPARDS